MAAMHTTAQVPRSSPRSSKPEGRDFLSLQQGPERVCSARHPHPQLRGFFLWLWRTIISLIIIEGGDTFEIGRRLLCFRLDKRPKLHPGPCRQYQCIETRQHLSQRVYGIYDS